MLISLRDIEDFRLHATDGDFGDIKAFLIDDFEWAVRYLVADTGERKILLSVLALGEPDMANRVLPVNLSSQRIMESPSVNLDMPLSRQMERQLSDYFEWPYYWEPDDVPNTMPGDLTSIPLIDMELDREEQEAAMEPIPATGGGPAKEESHLFSTRDLFGATIHTLNDDHDAGKLVDMIVGREDWDIPYLVVDTGGLLSGRKIVMAPTWVRQVADNGSRVDVDLKEETLKNSPSFNSVIDLTDEYQARLKDIYNQ